MRIATTTTSSAAVVAVYRVPGIGFKSGARSYVGLFSRGGIEKSERVLSTVHTCRLFFIRKLLYHLV